MARAPVSCGQPRPAAAHRRRRSHRRECRPRVRICCRFPGPMPLAAGQRETARRARAAAAKIRITRGLGRPLKSRLRTWAPTAPMK
jgi:hypothetical protein